MQTFKHVITITSARNARRTPNFTAHTDDSPLYFIVPLVDEHTFKDTIIGILHTDKHTAQSVPLVGTATPCTATDEGGQAINIQIPSATYPPTTKSGGRAHNEYMSVFQYACLLSHSHSHLASFHAQFV